MCRARMVPKIAIQPNPSTKAKPAYHHLLVYLLISTTLAVVARPHLESLLFNAHYTPSTIRPYDGERIRLLKFAIYATLDHPWTGWGLYQTPLAQAFVPQDPGLVRQLYPSTHNIFGDLFVWLGLPLGFFFSCILTTTLVRAIKPNQTARDHLPLQGILLTLAIHSLLEYPLYYLMWLGIFAALLVITNTHPTQQPLTTPQNDNHKAARLTRKAHLLTLALVIIICGSYIFMQERRATLYLNKQCTQSNILSSIIWQRYELVLNYICETTSEYSIGLDIAVLTGSNELFHQLLANKKDNTSGQRTAILNAGCRLGAFNYYCSTATKFK